MEILQEEIESLRKQQQHQYPQLLPPSMLNHKKGREREGQVREGGGEGRENNDDNDPVNHNYNTSISDKSTT